MGESLTLKAGDKTLLKEANFQFHVSKTIAITVKNGTGKTTLLCHIIQRGEGLSISPKAVIGSYEQMDYQFTKDETVLEYMENRSDYPESNIRSSLHSMGFKRDDLTKNVRNVSGGEAIRLVLCQLFLGRYNILVLDEPTNFLDVYSMEALEQFIKGYEGTVIIVSHDHTFIKRVADYVYKIKDQKMIVTYV